MELELIARRHPKTHEEDGRYFERYLGNGDLVLGEMIR